MQILTLKQILDLSLYLSLIATAPGQPHLELNDTWY